MYNFPFFSSPYYRNYLYNVNQKNPKATEFKQENTSNQAIERNNTPFENSNYEKTQKSTTRTDSSSTNDNKSRFLNNSQAFINILGIDLYSDDLLILCILLSLYLEGVKDELLFISLILLLLS